MPSYLIISICCLILNAAIVATDIVWERRHEKRMEEILKRKG